MYEFSMLCGSIELFVEIEYGPQIWEIIHHEYCANSSLKFEDVHPNRLIEDLSLRLSPYTGKSPDDLIESFGKYFVKFYSRIVHYKLNINRQRYFCEFLLSVDKIHSQMRLLDPKMESPAIQVFSVDGEGATITQSTSRKEISKYLIGQIIGVAKEFHNLEVNVHIVESRSYKILHENSYKKLHKKSDEQSDEVSDEVSDEKSDEKSDDKSDEKSDEKLEEKYDEKSDEVSDEKSDEKSDDISDEISGEISDEELHEKSSTTEIEIFIITYRLDFDNKNYMEHVALAPLSTQIILPNVDISILLKLFPFSVVLDNKMRVTSFGEYIYRTWVCFNPFKKVTSFMSAKITDLFVCRNPREIEMEYSTLLQQPHVFFELELISTDPSDMPASGIDFLVKFDLPGTQYLKKKSAGPIKPLLLQGQMHYLKDSDSLIYLCTPLIRDLGEFFDMELQLNDLQSYGLSRELVMAGWCEEDKVNYWKQKYDDLYYSGMPGSFASRMRLCEYSFIESYDDASIVLVEVINHVREPHAVSLEKAFSIIDEEIKLISPFVHKVHIAEMVCMIVAGVSGISSQHAEKSFDLALSLVKRFQSTKHPNLSIRIGINSGPVMAGIVDLKPPHFCVFGDTVKVASVMVKTSLPYKIQLSQHSKQKAMEGGYITKAKGLVKISKTENIATFWLKARPRARPQARPQARPRARF